MFDDNIADYVSLNCLEISKSSFDMIHPYMCTTFTAKIKPVKRNVSCKSASNMWTPCMTHAGNAFPCVVMMTQAPNRLGQITGHNAIRHCGDRN
jgi:hypothetical protein